MYIYCKESAFTLFELVVTMTILAIITVIALPHIHNFKERQELSKLLPMIQQHVSLAKNAATTYHTDVVICGSESLMACQNNQWHKGFIVFSDLNKNKKIDENEKILSALETDFKYGEFTWRGGIVNLHTITFKGDSGMPRGSQGAFYYCSYNSSDKHRYLPISNMGHTRIENIKSC